jgi:hypothetical protein
MEVVKGSIAEPFSAAELYHNAREKYLNLKRRTCSTR